MTTLLAGTDYDDLPPMFVIIFSPFDQFGDKERVSDYIVYCPKTHRALGDGTHVIYVNSKGVNGKVSPTMQKFLDLMNGQVDRKDALINDIAKRGNAVIYATCENSEILSITDRVYVMYDGKVMAELVTKNTSEDEIMTYAVGGKAASA